MTQSKNILRNKDNRSHSCAQLKTDHFSGSVKYKKLKRIENHYIGLWRSPYDNNLYLDVSIVLEDSKEARKLCKKFDQQTFFDLQTLNEVEVDRNANSGQ